MNSVEAQRFFVQQLSSLLKEVEAHLSMEERDLYAEFIDVTEYRLAFEQLFGAIVEDEIPIGAESFDRLVRLAKALGVDGMEELRDDLLGGCPRLNE